jgi:uncharacterized protein
MYPIPFLNNASPGKNNWWRYLSTIALSLVGANLIAAGFILVFILLYFFYGMLNGFDLRFGVVNLLSNPFFLIILVGMSYAFSFLIFYLCIRFIHKRSLLSVITIKSRVNWGKIVKGAILWAVILAVFTVPSLIWSSGDYEFTFNPSSFLLLLVISLIAFPIQSSFEEVFFRGYLMQGIGLLSKKPVIPLIITSVTFGLLHFFNGTEISSSIFIVLYTTILGLMLGIIVLGENGIETAVGVHIANNLFVALLFNSKDSGLGDLPSVFTSPPDNSLSGILVIIIAALIMITILFWNKKENLFNIFSLKQ